MLHKLGKRAPQRDTRNLMLEDYLPSTLPTPPAEVSWVTQVPSWPMYLNDELGCCVASAAGHMINQWTSYARGSEVNIGNEAILKSYMDVGGYIPGDPSTDNGMNMLEYLKYWRKVGVGGHKIMAFAQVDLSNRDQVFNAINLFGNLYLGVQLPISAQGEIRWTVPEGGAYGSGSPGSWGGHCIPVMAGSPLTGSLITWGRKLKMSWNFFKDYADEGYVVLSKDWIEANGLSPSSFNLGQLMQDLKEL